MISASAQPDLAEKNRANSIKPSEKASGTGETSGTSITSGTGITR
jgi:hypothetical protein